MKKLAIGCAILCMAISAHAQRTGYAYNQSKVSPLLRNNAAMDLGKSDGFRIPGERMRRTGSTLTLVGSGLLIGGIVLASDGHTKIDPYTGYEVADGKLALGTVMIVSGVGMIVPGIIFWSKGAKKYNRYMEQQQKTASFKLKGPSASIVFQF